MSRINLHTTPKTYYSETGLPGVRRGLAMLAVASVTVASGCGASSGSKPLTRAQLTAKANAICRRVISEVDWSKITPQRLLASVNRLAALEEQATAELNKLVPPASIADEWRLVVDGFRLTGREFHEIAQGVRENPQAYPAIPLSNAQHERGLDANILHIKECAKY